MYYANRPETWNRPEPRQVRPDMAKVATKKVGELYRGIAVWDGFHEAWRGVTEVNKSDAVNNAVGIKDGVGLVFEDGGFVAFPQDLEVPVSETGLLGWSSSTAAVKAMAETFEEALDRFIPTVQGHINDYYAREYPNSKAPTLECQHGTRYVRVVSRDHDHKGGSAFCFIDKTNGDVLKPAGWKGPAKGKRGSVYAKDFSGYGVNHSGAKHLR